MKIALAIALVIASSSAALAQAPQGGQIGGGFVPPTRVVSGGGDITGITTAGTSGLIGGCTTGTCTLSLLTTCSSTQVLKWNGTAWACAADSAGGAPSVQTSTATGTQNNFALSAGKTLLRFTSASSTNLTGMLRSGGNFDGDCVDIQYEGGSVFTLATSGGTASNNFSFNSSVSTYSLGDGNAGTLKTVHACYSTGTNRWGVTTDVGQCNFGQVQMNNSGSIQCVTPGDILGVTTTGPLSGGCTSGTCALTTSMATARAIGRVTASTGVAEELTSAQMTANFCDAFSTSTTTKGCTPGSNGASTSVLFGNGTWGAEVGDISGVTGTAPISASCTTGACTVTTSMATSRLLGRVTASTGVAEELTGTQATSLLDPFSTSTTTKGVVPGSNGATTSCLKGDGTWGACGGGGFAKVAPSATTGTIANWAPGQTQDSFVYVTTSGTTTIQGITGGVDGQQIRVYNAGAHAVNLSHNSGSATAANRMVLSTTTVVLDANLGCSLDLAYNTSLWYQVGYQCAGFDATTITSSGAIVVGTTLSVVGNSSFQGSVNTMGNASTDQFNFTGTATFAELVTATLGVTTPANLTTTSTGDLVSADDLIVADDSNLGDDQTDITSAFGRVDYLGTAPSFSGSSCACTIASYSTNARGRVTCTDGSPGTGECTITFAAPGFVTNPPACWVVTEKSTAVTAAPSLKGSPTTSAFTWFSTSSGAHGYAYGCDGMMQATAGLRLMSVFVVALALIAIRRRRRVRLFV